MKTLNKFLVLICIALVFSCDPDKGNDTDYLNNRDTSIFFTTDDATLFVEEGEANTYTISVGATAPAKTGLNYNISVDPSSTAVEGTDFTISNASFAFENGKIISTFTISASFANAIIDGKTAIFNLGSMDDSVIVASTNQFTLNLVKLCPFEGLNTTSYAASVFAFDEEAPSHNVTLVPVNGSDNQWTVATTWGPTFVSWATGNPAYDGLYLYSATLTLNDDFTVTVTGDDAWATGGSGLFSPCTQEFSFTLNQGLFTTAFTTDVVLSPM